MKKVLKLLIIVLVLSFSLPASTAFADPPTSAPKDLRGLWIASVVNIDYPSKPTTDSETLKNEAIKALDFAKDTGLNAIFLQVRPASDSLYKSKYFPWSKYLTGKQGLAPDGDFDPLEFWVEEAHLRGLQLHAWINPYRVTKKTASDAKDDLSSLAPSNPARLNPGWVVKHSDGNYYYNPGLPEVRKLIVDGVDEIVQNYDIDGIHFDDYFYPDRDFNDKAAFLKYGKNFINIDDWRRSNVNTLIETISKSIKASGKNIRFGISPFGIWANKKTNPLGSDTRGLESYYDHYADTRKWVKEHTIDYIAPQLYWNIGYYLADYSKLLDWWKNTVKGTGVDLYIGQASFCSGSSNQSSPWYGTSEIEKQLSLNAKTPEVKGSIFFNYQAFLDKPGVAAVIKSIYEKRDGLTTKTPITVASPASNISVSLDKYYIDGSSDPDKPLYLNGQLVENRSPKGYFGVLVPLVNEANLLTFSQEGSFTTRVIYRQSANAPEKMSSANIPASSAFPQSKEYRSPGEKITLSCQAPIGSNVSVKLGGKVYNMKAMTNTPPGNGLYATTYKYEYTVPDYSGNPRNVDLGAPVYSMIYKGITKTRTAKANIGVIMKNSPFFAKVTSNIANTYNSTTTSDGAAYELYKGMVDHVTAIKDDFIRLSSGQWVNKNSVTTYMSSSTLLPAITSATYKTGAKWDDIELRIPSPVAAIADFDGVSLKLNVSTSSKADLPEVPGDALFSAVNVEANKQNTKYTFSLNEGQAIEGYYIEKTTNGIILHIKRPVKALEGTMPLSGLSIMVDPGHGGSETGA
ncbi:MAG: family 10 glycosylhydrolase, partial [Bacillota bacterium]|nr:family 10 glycosylhydrolase [Bacillota bacterium]